MPARWSRYDTSPLPDPEGEAAGAAPTPEAIAAKSLVVRWDRYHVPTTVRPDWTEFANTTDSDSDPSNGQDGEDPPPAPERSRLHVRVDDLLELEQTILDQAKAFASRFNELRNRSQGVVQEGMWGLDEATYYTPRSTRYVDSYDPTPQLLPSRSAVATSAFLQAFVPSQQVALQHTANMVVVSGMLIEILDRSASIYAGQDQRSVFPDRDSIIRAETDPG